MGEELHSVKNGHDIAASAQMRGFSQVRVNTAETNQSIRLTSMLRSTMSPTSCDRTSTFQSQDIHSCGRNRWSL